MSAQELAARAWKAEQRLAEARDASEARARYAEAREAWQAWREVARPSLADELREVTSARA